jgi:monofunctional biosynthetic peptidoglycan transglycosylase
MGKARPKREARAGHRVSWRLGRVLLSIVLAVLMLAALTVLSLRWFNPPTTAFMLEASAAALWHGEHNYRTRYQWVPLEEISPQTALAVIASEDQQFPFHAGFDFKSIREAVRAHERGGKLRGASTISQQVAKNLFLWSGASFVRKGLEAVFTVMIEAFWPKERILEMYLNIAQYGRGIYGVQAAARAFFHKDAARLNSAEGALLAAALPNPELYRIDAPSPFVLSQRERILKQMANLGGPAYLNVIEPP